MKKIGIIVNANSRKNLRQGRGPAERYRAIGGDRVEVRETRSLEELDSMIREFRDADVPIIAIAGGDGSIHHAVTVAFAVYANAPLPAFLTLPGGTINNIAHGIRIRGNDYTILARAVSQLRAGRDFVVQQRNTIRAGSRYGFLFGNGFTADFLDAYYSSGKSYINVARVLCRSMLAGIGGSQSGVLRGFRGEVMADDRSIGFDRYFAILAGTVDHIGFGFRPLGRASSSAGTFQAIVNGMGPLSLIRHINKLRTGTPIIHPKNFDGVMKRLVVKTGETILYTLDGDLYTADGTLEAMAGPPVRFIIPD